MEQTDAVRQEEERRALLELVTNTEEEQVDEIISANPSPLLHKNISHTWDEEKGTKETC